jgi:hypothetical protein
MGRKGRIFFLLSNLGDLLWDRCLVVERVPAFYLSSTIKNVWHSHFFPHFFKIALGVAARAEQLCPYNDKPILKPKGGRPYFFHPVKLTFHGATSSDFRSFSLFESAVSQRSSRRIVEYNLRASHLQKTG